MNFTRGVQWLNRLYYDLNGKKNQVYSVFDSDNDGGSEYKLILLMIKFIYKQLNLLHTQNFFQMCKQKWFSGGNFWKRWITLFLIEFHVIPFCIYTNNGMVIWISWVDNCLFVVNKVDVVNSKKYMNNLFECDDVSEFKEWLKFEWRGNIFKFHTTSPIEECLGRFLN